MPTARKLALDVLREWSRGERYAAMLIDDAATQTGLAARDAALLQTLVYGVLRNVSLLDHWATELSGGREIDPASRWLLRLGLAQLLLLDMSAHASVNETVNLATRARGFINAILRRADRERAKLLAAVDQLPPPIRWSHPGPLVERLATFLPEADVLALLEWDQRPAETYVRVNGLHPDASQMSEMKEGWTPVGDGFFRCQSAPRGELAAGLCYAQDPSTALAVTLLDPKSGELILDACAAPGGKTALMAQMMKNQGLIVATDSSAARLKRLAGNLARMRVTNVNAALHDWASATHPEGAVAGKFDAILLDAPCSNTGVMRRRVDVRWRLDAAAFTAQAASQLALLKSVLRVLKPGGRLVYSTCSIDPEENTGVVDKLLQAHPDVKRLDERQTMPQKDGIDGAYAVLLRRG